MVTYVVPVMEASIARALAYWDIEMTFLNACQSSPP